MGSQQDLYTSLVSACGSKWICCSSILWVSNCSLIYTGTVENEKYKLNDHFQCATLKSFFFHINQSVTSDDTSTLSVMRAVLDPHMPSSLESLWLLPFEIVYMLMDPSLALLLHFYCLAQFSPYKMCKVLCFCFQDNQSFFSFFLKKKLARTNCPLHLLHIDTNIPWH